MSGKKSITGYGVFAECGCFRGFIASSDLEKVAHLVLGNPWFSQPDNYLQPIRGSLVKTVKNDRCKNHSGKISLL